MPSRQLTALIQRLITQAEDGTGTRQLDRGRIYILPTAAGWLYAILLSVMLLTAINYKLSLGHAWVFLLASLGFIGILHTFRNLHGLRFTPGQAVAVFAGESASFPLYLENPSRRQRPNLHLSSQQGARLDFTLNPYQQQQLQIPVASRQRGRLKLPALRLSTRYPLGLFQAWAKLTPQADCLVYPAPETPAPPLPPLASNSAAHAHQRACRPGDDDFAGLRPRQTGEALHHVDWKAHARRAPDAALLIKQFTGEEALALSLDWQMTAALPDTEQRLARLCAWVLQAEAAGLHYALRLPGWESGNDRSAAHQARCLAALAIFPTSFPQ